MREEYIQWKNGSFKGHNKMKSSGLAKSFKISYHKHISLTYYIIFAYLKKLIREEGDPQEIINLTQSYTSQLKKYKMKGNVEENIYQIFTNNVEELVKPLR